MKDVNTVVLSNLSIGYKSRRGQHCVAGGISGTIRGGELTCLIGANGAGKSTLLRTLSGFLPRLGGTVSVCGRDISDYGGKELSRTIGIVLTERPDVNNMTVRELVCLGRSPYTGFWGAYSSEDIAVADRAMALVGIGQLARRRIRTLSDGERQKAMIAKALSQQTPVIFLDEPTAFLDFPSKVEVMRLLHRISRETGKIVFLSTHDLDIALQIADVLWLMDSGGRLTVGMPEDLSIDGRLASFFAHDNMTFDPSTGLFAIDTPTTMRACVTAGNGIRRDMLCKAMRRNGIMPVGGECRCGVVVGSDDFAVSINGVVSHVSSIAAVLDLLLSEKRAAGQ